MLNELSKEIHANAVAHGWYNTEPSFEDTIANIHAELSEAWEEYRNGTPMTYYKCNVAMENGYEGLEATTDNVGPDCDEATVTCAECSDRNPKPEGIAVELADCVIRILDYCGWKDIDIDALIKYVRQFDASTRSFSALVATEHYFISKAYDSLGKTPRFFAHCIWFIQIWLSENGIDLIEVIKLKHEYNKQRSYRHGGKIV